MPRAKTAENDSLTGGSAREGRPGWQCWLAFVAVLLPLACRAPGRAASAPEARRITVIFRLDDYARPSANLGAELLTVFQRHNVPCTYGVIPYASDTFVDDPAACPTIDLKTAGRLTGAVQSGLVEVALHGFTHRANSIASTEAGSASEFRGLSYAAQLRMLSAGRAALESLYRVRVTTFIPPWNSYDENTLRALADLGFELVSSSGETHGIASSESIERLRFLPYTCVLGHLREAVEFARNSSDPDPIVVVLLHAFNFVEGDRERGQFTSQSLAELLAWLAAQPDVVTRTLGGAAKMTRDLSYRRLRAYSIRRGARQGNEPAVFTARNAEFFFYPSAGDFRVPGRKRAGTTGARR